MLTAGTGNGAGADTVGTAAGRRRVLTIAAADYPEEDEEFGKAVRRQIDMLETWWGGPAVPGGEFEVEHASPVLSRRDVEDFLHFSDLRESQPQDVLFVFVAGHGMTTESRRHYLVLPRSERRRLLATGFPTAEVARAALGSHAEHILIIVNTCESGGIVEALDDVWSELGPGRRRDTVLAVLSTADFDEEIPIGAFGAMLERLHQRLTSVSEITSEYLSLDTFMNEMNSVVDAEPAGGLRRLRRVREANAHKPHFALPNPRYRAAEELVQPPRRQVAVPQREMSFWIERASGAPSADGHWYFSGRRELNRQVAQFLSEDPETAVAGALIVTGTAGSGKSAVLARAVTFADPSFLADERYRAAVELSPPDTVAPSESVQAAIRATNRTSRQVLTLLLEALGGFVADPAAGADSVQDLLDSVERTLAARPTVTTIVIDAVDEADSPYLLATQVINRLARLSHPPRLVLGVRSPRPTLPLGTDPSATTRGGIGDENQLLALLRRVTTVDGRTPLVLRTDGAHTEDDIVEYVQAMLEGTTAAGPETARALLGAITDKASFLEAGIAANQLCAAPDALALFLDPRWQTDLGSGTVGLLRQDLIDSARPELQPDVALALLRATAFALGAGVPRADLWPAIAEAVADRPLPDAESAIEALLSGRLAGYLSTDVEAERVVYRPLHKDLARILREQPGLLRIPMEQA